MPAQSRKAVYTAAERAILDPYKEEYDNLAKMLGVPALPFAKVHKDFAAQIKRTIGYYVKGLLKMVNPTDGVTDDVAAPPSFRPNLEVDSTGYPKVPTSVDLTRLSKVDMER